MSLFELICKSIFTMFILTYRFFENPRTTMGWKGLINEPYIDGSFDFERW